MQQLQAVRSRRAIENKSLLSDQTSLPIAHLSAHGPPFQFAMRSSLAEDVVRIGSLLQKSLIVNAHGIVKQRCQISSER